MQSVEETLGRGLLIPFRRQGGDFANNIGAPLVESAVRQLMITRKGDLRWRQNVGIDIDNYRHRNISVQMLAELEGTITEQLQTHEPRIEILSIEVKQKSPEDTKAYVRLVWQATNKKKTSAGGTYLSAIQTTEVVI